MSYGVIGTSPLSDLDATIEHNIALFLQANYDQTITGIPSTDIMWEQWFLGMNKDVSIYFEHAGEFDMSMELTWALKESDHYTDIHIFVRSMKLDYNNSADKYLFLFEKWIKKVLREQKEGLKDKGILLMDYRSTRRLPTDALDQDDVKRMVISIRSKIMWISS